MKGLLEGLGGLLCLAPVTFQALLRFALATRSGFGVFFGASCGWGHGELLGSAWILCEP
jgi:hypothetical protein